MIIFSIKQTHVAFISFHIVEVANSKLPKEVSIGSDCSISDVFSTIGQIFNMSSF